MYYEAFFQPQNLTYYVKEAETLVGKNIPLQGGLVSKDGPHKGQQCFYMANSKMGLIPFEDLKDIKSIGLRRWQEIQRELGLADE